MVSLTMDTALAGILVAMIAGTTPLLAWWSSRSAGRADAASKVAAGAEDAVNALRAALEDARGEIRDLRRRVETAEKRAEDANQRVIGLLAHVRALEAWAARAQDALRRAGQTIDPPPTWRNEL